MHVTGSAANISGPEFFDAPSITKSKIFAPTGIMSTLKDFATSPVGIATLGATRIGCFKWWVRRRTSDGNSDSKTLSSRKD